MFERDFINNKIDIDWIYDLMKRLKELFEVDIKTIQ